MLQTSDDLEHFFVLDPTSDDIKWTIDQWSECISTNAKVGTDRLGSCFMIVIEQESTIGKAPVCMDPRLLHNLIPCLRVCV